MEKHQVPEALPRSKRILILGSHGSGALDLTAVLQAQLNEHGLQDMDVGYGRYINNLESLFYGRHWKPKEDPAKTTHELPELVAPVTTPKKNGLVRRLAKLLVRSEQAQLASLTEQAKDSETKSYADSLPYGVIILPKMRRDTELGQETIDTPYGEIEELCKKHGVEYIKAELLDSPDAVDGFVVQISKSANQERGELPSPS